MVKPRPADPPDQTLTVLEPSASRKSAAPHARQQPDWLAAVHVLHKAANVTSQCQHRGLVRLFCPPNISMSFGFQSHGSKMLSPMPQARSAGLELCVARSLAKYVRTRRSVVQRRRCRVTAANLMVDEPIKRLRGRTFSLE